MKKLLFIFILISSFGFSQSIEDYQKKLETFESRIKSLNDSIKITKDIIKNLKVKEFNNLSGNKYKARLLKNAKVRIEPEPLSEIIFITDEDLEIEVDDFQFDYFKICSKTNCGYVNSLYVQPSDELLKFMEFKKEVEEANRLKIIALNQKNQEKINKEYTQSLKRKFGENLYSKLISGYFWLGMTKEMAEISFGNTSEKSEYVNAYSKNEVWYYGNITLYFTNGKLASYSRH